MNCYRVLAKSADGAVLLDGNIEARSLEVAAGAMKSALRSRADAVRSELWLDGRQVSVIVKRAKRLIMIQDAPGATEAVMPPVL